MEPICAIKDIYKILYQFEKNFSEVHAITINEAMLLCCLKDNEAKSAGMICDYIGLSNSRVSKVITSVENKGFIRRNINKEDKRQMFSRSPKRERENTTDDAGRANMDSLFKSTQRIHTKEIPRIRKNRHSAAVLPARNRGKSGSASSQGK